MEYISVVVFLKIIEGGYYGHSWYLISVKPHFIQLILSKISANQHGFIRILLFV